MRKKRGELTAVIPRSFASLPKLFPAWMTANKNFSSTWRRKWPAARTPEISSPETNSAVDSVTPRSQFALVTVQKFRLSVREYEVALSRRDASPPRAQFALVSVRPRSQLDSSFNRFVNTSRTAFSGRMFFSIPRSASTIRSREVTSTVPFIGVLNSPIFALSVKVSIGPCQLFCFTTSRTGSPAFSCNISSNDRSTDAIIAAFERLCAIVIRKFRLASILPHHLNATPARLFAAARALHPRITIVPFQLVTSHPSDRCEQPSAGHTCSLVSTRPFARKSGTYPILEIALLCEISDVSHTRVHEALPKHCSIDRPVRFDLAGAWSSPRSWN